MVLSCIANSILGGIVERIKSEVSHLVNYSSNVEELRSVAKDLSGAIKSIQEQIEEADNRGESLVDSAVERWQEKATSLDKEASGIIGDEDRSASSTCLMGLRPNLWACYLASKKSITAKEKAVKLREEAKTFARVAGIDYLHCLAIKPSPDFDAFKSRQTVSNDIAAALKNPKVHMVGVHGMAGLGKTTLVEKVSEQLHKDGTFKYVVMALVSQKPDVKKIQQEIADQLRIKLDATTDKERARQLMEKLEKREKLLIVLDDIWETLEFNLIGIPFLNRLDQVKDVGLGVGLGVGKEADPHRKSFQTWYPKILMTSRNESLLKNGMGSTCNFELKILSDPDAWNLFQNTWRTTTAGIPQDCVSIAKKVVERCSGLPILLVIVATALRNADLSIWRDALRQLEMIDSVEFVDSDEVYKKIELSYKCLKSDEIKSLFRLFGQLDPYNYNTFSYLLKCTTGLSLFKGCRTLEQARDRLHKCLNDLKAHGLLQDVGKLHDVGNSEEAQLRMHDVVHKFAVFVGGRDHHMLTVPKGDKLEEWPSDDDLEAVALNQCHLPQELPASLHVPKLASFLMLRKQDDHPLEIPDKFFLEMKRLKLMDLTRVSLSPALPSSLNALEKLQTLCLDLCELENIAIIGELPMLQVLSLNGSCIRRLPNEIGNLGQLKLLDLDNCSKLKEIASDHVLSKLTSLEELCMKNSFKFWEREGYSSNSTDAIFKNASLGELKNLPNLISLTIHIPHAEMFPKDLVAFKKLERFRILTGEALDWNNHDYRTSRTLKLKLAESPNELGYGGIEALMRRAEDVYLQQLNGFESLCELDSQGFPHMKHLNVQKGVQIQYIVISISSCVVFPKLESLVLQNLTTLQKIICRCGGGGQLPFKNLSVIKVARCNGLTNLFLSSLARGLLCLKEIEVIGCKNMETIVFQERDQSYRTDYQDHGDVDFTELRALTLRNLPHLITFYSNLITNPIIASPAARTRQEQQHCALGEVASDEIVDQENKFTTPNPLLIKKIIFRELKELKLSRIRVEKIWDVDQLATAAESWFSCFQNLQSLILDGCDKITYLLLSAMVKSLAQLKRLEVSSCESMKEIVFIDTSEEIISEEIISFPNLNIIQLKSLPNLRGFCNITNLIEFPSLAHLCIQDCPELRTFTGLEANVALFDEKVAFPNLEELKIAKMGGVKMIWGDELHPSSFSKLKTLGIEKGSALLSVFSSRMVSRALNLESLIISECESLIEVFDVKMLMSENKLRSEVQETQLKTLHISKLQKLKHLWNEDPHGLVSFQNLRSVSVEECPSLTSLFPISVALGLHQLEELNIYICEGMDEIVSGKEDIFPPEFVFPKMTKLQLWTSPELKRFYPGSHTSEWPILNSLRIYHCDKIDLFGSKFQSIRVEDCKDQEQLHARVNQQPFLSFTKIMPNLERVALRSMDMERIYDKASLFLADKVKAIDLLCFHDDSQVFPIEFLQRFQNLNQLLIGCSSFKQLFTSELLADEANVKSLARVSVLLIDHLNKMTHIWDGEFDELDRILQNLEYLDVLVCNHLINLAPSNALFPNLTYLAVTGCKQLVQLITSSSTTKSLANLTKMRISECDSLTEIVASGDHEDEATSNIEDNIVFPKLAYLTLQSLASLTSFYSATNCNFVFPSLVTIIVAECPKMKLFCQGALSTPKLKRLQVKAEDEEEKEELRWEGDLNSTVRQLYIETVISHQRLRLTSYPVLQDMWHDELPAELYSALRFLEVDKCTYVTYVISSSLLRSLNSLEELHVTNSNSLEEVFDGSNDNVGDNVGLSLSELRDFYLIDLPSLMHVCPENLEGVLDFKNLTLMDICNCSSLSNHPQQREGRGVYGDDNILIFPQLSSLLLESLHCLSSFYSGNGVLDCPCLEKITITDCPKMETFTSTTRKEKQVSTIGEDQKTIGNKALFNDKVAFPNLEELKIAKMGGVKMIWGDELHPSSFSKLKTLGIEQGSGLLSVFSSGMVSRTLNLESLIISECESLIEVFDVNTVMSENKLRGEVQETQLKTLHISKLQKLKHLWNEDTHGLVSFQNLRSVSVQECPSLTSLFPVSVALGLHQLEELIIDICEGMEEIVSGKEHIFPPKFVFPNMTKLQLWRSPELKRFYPGSHTSECPILKNLNIYHCDKIYLFGSEFQSIRGEVCEDQEQLHTQVNQQPFLCFTKILPNLEEVSLRSLDMEIIYDKASLFLADKVKVIDLLCFHDDSQVFPIELLQRFQNLKTLVVWCSGFKQLFPSELLADEANVKALARIPHLEIGGLNEMTHIWHGEFDELNRILQNLEHLEVRDCNHLINLAPSNALFPNLTYLGVTKCKQLVHLITSSSTTKSLANLTEMRISECDSLTEIVASADHGDEATSNIEDTIVFSKLEALILRSLASLTSFCSAANCNFMFPSLVTVLVEECPKMKLFCQGALSTPTLIRIPGKPEDAVLLEADLNSTVRQFNIETVFEEVTSHKRLKLSSYPVLQDMWHDKLLEELFSALRFLEVDECTFVTYAISSSLLRSLNNLEELRVTNNNSLEEVFDGSKELELTNDNVGENVGLSLSELRDFYLVNLPSLMHVCPENLEGELDFKNLTLMVICHCSSLRYVFTTSMVLCLVHIQKIQVKSCDRMEAIILNKEKVEGLMGDDNILIFPQLSSLLLESLHCLSSFYSGNGVLDSPSLEKITIIDCPKMETFTSTSKKEKQSLVFPKLEHLKLQSLASLTSLCSAADCDFVFPSLVSICVEECPKLKLFCQGALSTPMHPGLWVRAEEDEKEEELCSEGDLNSTVRVLHVGFIGSARWSKPRRVRDT